MRNKVMAFAALNLVMAAPAMAADMPAPEPVYVPGEEVRPAFDWSGFYVGAQGGYAQSQVGFRGESDRDLSGGTFGIYGGYNFTYAGLVLGVENDVNYNWNDGDSVVGLDWDGSARARVGYAWDRILVYGTAGLAAAGGSVDVAGFRKKDDVLIGWTAGAGVEYAFTDNILFRTDYRYSDFGNVDFGDALGEFEADQHRVTVGVSYKF
ncbi:outer membrane protein [Pleomorphomonas carboxyditropha]|uniref:Outer membrane protein beta-barrel domain-containing protein n=2 Tax=Pleomorphomonas TaxID=261933 RepID=A0A2G9WRJ5_9HYPH|nr:outer membrane protein [Pleomorphomonas carboxyditropha]PIO97329.1 hypothetical protein CJ014_21220 [Pleomorphomonas carboxyditropha]